MTFTAGFTSSNWTWGGRPTRDHPKGDQRIVGASLYYRGALAAAQFRAKGLGGWVAERYRTTPSGALEILDYLDHEWHTPDVFWHNLLFKGDDWERSTWNRDRDAIRSARAAGQIVIADVDDDYWAIPKNNNAYDKWSNGRGQYYFDQLAACDAIVCSTEALCYRAASLGPSVYLIRNAVDTTWLRAHDPARKAVSWIGSVPWRSRGDLALLRAAGLSGWLDANSQVAYHGGALDPPELTDLQRSLGAHYERYPSFSDQTGVRPDQLTTRPNVMFSRYPSLWEPVGVSLVPMEDVAFNRAKSWLKGLESCAAGVPVIASSMPEYEALAADGAAIRFARRPKDWTRHLTELLDPGLRREEGRRNRLVAERNDVADLLP